MSVMSNSFGIKVSHHLAGIDIWLAQLPLKSVSKASRVSANGGEDCCSPLYCFIIVAANDRLGRVPMARHDLQ
jgi:hypothetical protein